MALAIPQPSNREAQVLTTAFLRASRELGMSQAAAGRVIGKSAASISRFKGERRLDPAAKSGEAALLLLRIYRSLDALVGGNRQQARAWFHADNEALGGEPAELVEKLEGLTRVARYLDAMRGAG